MSKTAGFTLVELLLSVAILTILTGLSLPVYETFARRNDLDLASQTLVSTLRRAETYARGVKNDSVWSVEVASGTVTLFQGTSFASRNTAYDETYDIPDSITTSGISEVQFSKLTAAPNTTGTVTLTSTTNDSKAITINAKGMVDY